MSKLELDEESKKKIAGEINLRFGSDITDISSYQDLSQEWLQKKQELITSLRRVQQDVPLLIKTAIKKAQVNSEQICSLSQRSEHLKSKVEVFLEKAGPLREGLDKRLHTINKLEQVLQYLKSFEKIEEISRQMKQSNDDEQLVLLYQELRVLCKEYQGGHCGTYLKEYTHYWHNVLKDKITKHYEDVLKQLKWPLTLPAEPIPKEVTVKFCNLTRYLLLIKEPEDLISTATASEDFDPDQEPCLPVKILLRPLKKRFAFHFTGSRQTARIDRPEWFLTQTLTWIKVHQEFIRKHVQSVADKLELKNVRAVDEFNAGLIALAAERLHIVLATYQSSKGEIVDVDAAFAHAVDETLGFNRELTFVTGKEVNSVLSVLTRAETMLRWLSVEKKYALAKMDETLQSEYWSEPVAGGANSAVGALLWVPRSADWFITLLKTIEERYAMLPQPGHRLQFLDLQLEMIEEWRIRLTQLLSAATESLTVDTFMNMGLSSTPHPLIAVVNAAHHTYTVLLQWAHSLHYLQLHYYKRQFEHYTHLQHCDEESSSSSSSSSEDANLMREYEMAMEGKWLDQIDFESKERAELEVACRALNDIEQNKMTMEGKWLHQIALESKEQAEMAIARRALSFHDITRPIANLAVAEHFDGDQEAEDAGVFLDAPALLAHLRDSGLTSLADHIVLEFKAGLRDYKRQKWHAMPMVAEKELCVSPALCAPLSGLCTRLASASARLSPALSAHLRAQLAAIVDEHIFQEVVVENWFNLGGTLQLDHDVKRNLVPAFSTPNKPASQIKLLPKLLQSCKLLNLDYEDARRLRAYMIQNPAAAAQSLQNIDIAHIPPQTALFILSHRNDMCQSAGLGVPELF